MINNSNNFPTVSDIRTVSRRGPWQTKSGGELGVFFGIPFNEINDVFFNYEVSELNNLQRDIRGLRAYEVRDIPKGNLGANEWHRIRNELVFALDGKIRWSCEDVYGDNIEFVLNKEMGIWTPPYILHTYEVLDNKGGILVIANTLFFPDDASSHDTYSLDAFRELQFQYKNKHSL
jgi:oxalate decarboxylase/phosphoglucose isomerase-like protein (cupin superfamily)